MRLQRPNSMQFGNAVLQVAKSLQSNESINEIRLAELLKPTVFNTNQNNLIRHKPIFYCRLWYVFVTEPASASILQCSFFKLSKKLPDLSQPNE